MCHFRASVVDPFHHCPRFYAAAFQPKTGPRLTSINSSLPRAENLVVSSGNELPRYSYKALTPTPADFWFQESNEVGLQLEGLSDTTGMRAPAGIYEFGAHDFRFDLERDDVDLFPAPDMHERRVRARKPMKLPELGHALTAWKGWWEQEFLFRGFGIGFVKPLFRGLLLRPDFGLGVRLPLTLHFRSWESREALPSVALSFFVLWPPAVQVSQAMSYPAESLQEWVTTAARKIAVPSKEKLQVRNG